MAEIFKFKNFKIDQTGCAMKVGTDGVLLGAWVGIDQKHNVIDIGTGTGVIALMIAQRNQKAQVVGIEIDEPAAKQAVENFKNSPWKDRLSISQEAIQDYSSRSEQTFDLVISNPPFFTGGTLSNTQDKTSVRHTVKLPHGDLLRSARSLLSKAGRFAVILPNIEGQRFIEMASTYNMHVHRLAEVYPDATKKVERLMIEFGKSKAESIVMEEIFIRNPDGKDFAKEYKALTRDFYLKF